jgi:hypothetical protein
VEAAVADRAAVDTAAVDTAVAATGAADTGAADTGAAGAEIASCLHRCNQTFADAAIKCRNVWLLIFAQLRLSLVG